MSQSQPKILVDHCLGTKHFPNFFHEKGLDAVTVEDFFGRQKVTDVEWLELAGRSDWVVFTKDYAIRKNTAELQALVRYGVRMVCLINRSLLFDQMAELVDRYWSRIERRFDVPGPWLITIGLSGINTVKLPKKTTVAV